jgi:hypothetical protein
MKTILISYLKQESTWRGLLQFATAIGIGLRPDQSAAILSAGIAAVGAINTFKNK